jgi:tryptophan synthase alpha chain
MNPFKKEKKQLSIFVTAGYPQLSSLNEQLAVLENKKIDFVEVGIPFSDPLADGPTIQATSELALKNGMNLQLIFDQLAERKTQFPIVLMGYLNPVLAFGVEPFLTSCKEVGVHCVILPDMSLEIYERFYHYQFENYGVIPAFLVTPTTSDDRIRKIAEMCAKSFVYLVSSNATTGSNSSFGHEESTCYRHIKELCGETPLFIGFGIDSREKIEFVQRTSDGAIVGSAYLKALGEGKDIAFLDELTALV